MSVWGLEYRTPCSFLASPKVTFLNLSLAKVCAVATAHNINVDAILRACKPKDVLKAVVSLIKSNKKFSCKDIQLTKELLELAFKNKSSIRVKWYTDFKRRWGV